MASNGRLAGTAGYGDGVSRAFWRSPVRDPERPDRPPYRHRSGHRHPEPLYRRQDPGQRQPVKEPGDGGAGDIDCQEQTSFNNAVNAYVGVIQAQQLLALQINNEQVLAKQLQATNDRFRVGEITRTDVAQAEAALEGARATRETAEGSLQTARGTFRQFVGLMPPDNLIEPQPLNLPVNSEQEAAVLAAANNPNVITALFYDAAAKDAVDVAFAALLPQVSLQGQTFQQNNVGGRSTSEQRLPGDGAGFRAALSGWIANTPRCARRARRSSRPTG